MLRPFAHPVACCWMLLRVVAQSLKPVKLFSQKLPTFLLFRDLRIVAQQCWIRLHSRLPTCWGHACSLRTVYKDLWVVSFPRYTAGPNIVGKCCIRLHAALDIKHYVLLLLRAHIPQIIRIYNSLKNGETKTSCAE